MMVRQAVDFMGTAEGEFGAVFIVETIPTGTPPCELFTENVRFAQMPLS